MLCENPYTGSQGVFPCGQCMPCRISRRRIWTHRILLEAHQWSSNAFVTLTYQDDKLPVASTGLPTLDPVHVKNWLKRIRKAYEPERLRFYLAGEYGDESQRPHYHVALFNFPRCLRGNTLRRVETRSRPLWSDCCSTCRLVGDTWGYGDVDVGRLEPESAQYICGYVTKKMTARDDMRLLGRYPEFARQSRRPGVGHGALHEIASEWLRLDLASREADVPSALRHGGRLLPLGRYLRRELRSLVGMEKEAPQSTLDEAAARLQGVREDAFNRSVSFKKAIVEAGKQKNLNAKVRMDIRKKGKLL